jgi:hypothetical protein
MKLALVSSTTVTPLWKLAPPSVDFLRMISWVLKAGQK